MYLVLDVVVAAGLDNAIVEIRGDIAIEPRLKGVSYRPRAIKRGDRLEHGMIFTHGAGQILGR